MERILRGIMRYRVLDRASMVKQFQEVKDNPTPKAVFYTCMDSRMIPTRFTETSVGDMFVVRNAGNVIPHSQYFVDEMTSCEPAALELGCIINDIRHIIVCGHSDCKAMNLLYTLKSKEESSIVNTLQQLQNVASYGMLKKRLEKHDLHIHALWFDIYTGDIYYFSRRAKQFIIIDESTYEVILSE
ncbi:Carbonic anhydrase, partial [Operophtera brumata]